MPFFGRQHQAAADGSSAAVPEEPTYPPPIHSSTTPRANTVNTEAPVNRTSIGATSSSTAEPIREKPGRDLETGLNGDMWVDPYGPAPTFKEWIKLYWHDVAAFIFLGAIALWLLLWSPIPYRKLFAVTFNPQNGINSSSEIVNPGFAYPKQRQIIGIIPDAMMAVFVPIISICFVNFFGIGTYGPLGKRLRVLGKRRGCFLGRGSFWNVNNGCMGVVYAVMTGAVIQIIIKLVVGGLRPHFLTVCDPQITTAQGQGFGSLYFDTSICRDSTDPRRRDEIANAMQSFPSGHSVAIWAGLFYLSLYFNAHLKIFSNYHPSFWKLILFCTPLVAATLIVGALMLDMTHNWYDIVVGSAIGVLMAILAYRMCFASVWDFRWNHVPLRRGSRDRFTYGQEELSEWTGGAATRRAGWGISAGFGIIGAPGDSTALEVGFGRDIPGRGRRVSNEVPGGVPLSGDTLMRGVV